MDTEEPGAGVRSAVLRPVRPLLRALGTGLLAAVVLVASGTATAPGVVSADEAARPFAELLDHTGIAADGAPMGADLDGTGRGLSAGSLAAAGWLPGQRLVLLGTELDLPDYGPGRPDHVLSAGQRVGLAAGHGPGPVRGTALTLLLAGSSADGSGTAATGPGRVVYTDGHEQRFTLTAPDWRQGPLSTAALVLPHRDPRPGEAGGARLYARSVPLDPGRDVSYVQLPRTTGRQAQMRIFAMGLRPAQEWTGTWSRAVSGYTAVGPWQDQTLRLVARTGPGGSTARIRLENTFAQTPVRIGAASLAPRREGAASERPPVPLTFGGQRGTVVPAGGQVLSDPVDLRVPAGGDLLVSLHLPERVTAAPVHTGAADTAYLSEPGSGDLTGAIGEGSFTGTFRYWPFLTGVDVLGGPGAIVALGDSITDGTGATPDAGRRWTDVLSRRLAADPSVPHHGVLNQGIAGNHVMTDLYAGGGAGASAGGVSVLNRLERDVLAQTGAHTVIVYAGVNDVRAGTSAQAVAAGLGLVARRARGQGMRVVVATLAPCGGEPRCTGEADLRRRQVNDFIRDQGAEGGLFDAVWDVDAVLRDPDDTSRLRPEYDSGDHLHPGDAGLWAIAQSLDPEPLRAE